MILHFSFKRMESSDSLKLYAEEKSGKLAKYFHGRITVNFSFAHEKAGRVVRCHLVGNHMDYVGEAVSEDFHAAIDAAISKLEKQLRRHKEIVKNHLHRASA